MSRIAQTFQRLRERGEKALVVYLTAGDPDLDKTGEILVGLVPSSRKPPSGP